MKKTQEKHLKRRFSPRIFLMLFFSLVSLACLQAQDVKGRVVDDAGEALIGVSVAVKNTTKGTMTDMDGRFTLSGVEAKSVLVFSYLGYHSQEIPVGTKKNIDVKLKDDATVLDEMVVIGFQSQKKVNLTAAVSYIGSEAFENRPVANIGQALQGAIPGLNISIDGGAPNKVPSLNIRGGTTLAQKDASNRKLADYTKFELVSGAPLILMDGIEISNEDLNQLNPADIESMSVLKDASAAAIYGTRATFGVVLVQTKSGKLNQKAKVNYSFDMSFDQPVALPDILNSYTIYKAALDKKIMSQDATAYTAEETKMLEGFLAYMNDPKNVKPYYVDGDDGKGGGTIKWHGNTNPFKELVKDWTPMQKHNVSVTGGSDRISYYMSLGSQTQDGMFKVNTDKLRRYNMMMSLNAKITDRFSIGAKASYNIFNYKEPSMVGNIWYTTKNDVPTYNIYMPLMTAADDFRPNAMTENPTSAIFSGGQSKTSRKTSIFSISPEFVIIPKELTIKADLSLTPVTYTKESSTPRRERVKTSWLALETIGSQYNDGTATRSNTDRYAINVYANYNKTFAKDHEFSALFGVNQEREKYAASTVNMTKLIDPFILNPELVEEKALNTSTNGHHEITSRALFGRVMYNYKSRYLVEVDGRYDGSSKFPKDNRFQFFPTFSLGWRFSDEKFMEGTKTWLDNAKLRGSWGKLGSQPGSKYPYQSLYDTEEGYFLFEGTRYPLGLVAPGLVDPNLTWQKSTTTNLGLDVIALRNRLSITAEWYERKVSDILIAGGKDYPALLGDFSPLVNAGVFRSRGIELAVKWNDKLANGLRYSIGFTLADGKTKMTDDPSNPIKSLIDGKNHTGKYFGEIWGYETGGILQEEDFDVTVDDKGKKSYTYKGAVFSGEIGKVFPGYLWYKDLDGDGIISNGENTVSNPGDRKVIGNETPRYRYSITANAQYKGFDLDLMFQGVGKRDVWIGSASSYWGNGAGSWETFNNSWTPERTNAKFPMYGSSIGGRAQSGYLLDGSYFMLRQAILGYTLPKSLVNKVKLDRIRVHVSGYNLFSISDIPSSYDVESVADRYPPKRTLAFGIQVGF